MKKLISLLLVIIITCSVLSGCDWDSLIDYITPSTAAPKWEAPEGVIETAMVDENGNSITIAHSDNFTQDDIEFVIYLHGKLRSVAAIEPPPNYNLNDILSEGMNGNPIFLSHFENPYFVSAYLKSDAFEYELNKWGEYKFDVTKYVWYKFYNSEQIVDEIGEMERTKDTYLLYDCIVERDIVNKVEYNKNCKCYMEYRGKYVLDKMFSDMLIYFDSGLVSDVTGNSKFIFYPEFGSGGLEIYTDEDNIEYLYFSYGVYTEDGAEYKNYAKELFGEHYEYLSQYFEILDEYVNDSGRTVKSAGIRLDIIDDYLSNRR